MSDYVDAESKQAVMKVWGLDETTVACTRVLMLQECSRVILGLLLNTMHAQTKDRPQDGDDSTELRDAQVRSYVSQGSRAGFWCSGKEVSQQGKDIW